jgi:hypothetical protein
MDTLLSTADLIFLFRFGEVDMFTTAVLSVVINRCKGPVSLSELFMNKTRNVLPLLPEIKLKFYGCIVYYEIVYKFLVRRTRY